MKIPLVGDTVTLELHERQLFAPDGGRMLYDLAPGGSLVPRGEILARTFKGFTPDEPGGTVYLTIDVSTSSMAGVLYTSHVTQNFYTERAAGTTQLVVHSLAPKFIPPPSQVGSGADNHKTTYIRPYVDDPYEAVSGHGTRITNAFHP